MVDWGFIATIGVIFAASLIGAWLRFRRRDICLAAFNNFHVTLELADGRRVWGRLEVLSTGLELRYRSAVQDDAHLESSYLLYDNEFESILTIFRYADDLSPGRQQEREKAIKRAFHPNLFRRLGRKIRIFISTASESLNEVVSLAIGRARQPVGQFVTANSETHLKRLGSDLLGQVGRKADPLLERLVGIKVVFETVEDGVVHEHVGVFKNYSRDFLELLDVQFPCREQIPVVREGVRQLAGLKVQAVDDVIRVINGIGSPVMLLMLSTGDQEQYLDVVVDPGGEVVIYSEFKFERATLHTRIVRELDVIIPRTRAIIRHRAEINTQQKLSDIIFDVGVRLPLRGRQDRMIANLQKKLQANPHDVCAMSVLGGMMIQNQSFDEAERLLTQAYAMRRSLPDNGRNVERRLRELARRRSQTDSSLVSQPRPLQPNISIPVQDVADMAE